MTRNNSKNQAQKFFQAFLRQNLIPNGRMRDDNGGYHRDPNFLESRFFLLREAKDKEEMFSFGDEFMRALATVELFDTNEKLFVSAKTPVTWLNKVSGNIHYTNGVPKCNV